MGLAHMLDFLSTKRGPAHLVDRPSSKWFRTFSNVYVSSVFMSLYVHSPPYVCSSMSMIFHVHIPSICMSPPCMSPSCVCPLHVYVPSMCMSLPRVYLLGVYVSTVCISPTCVCPLRVFVPSVWCLLRVYVSIFGCSFICMLPPCICPSMCTSVCKFLPCIRLLWVFVPPYVGSFV